MLFAIKPSFNWLGPEPHVKLEDRLAQAQLFTFFRREPFVVRPSYIRWKRGACQDVLFVVKRCAVLISESELLSSGSSIERINMAPPRRSAGGMDEALRYNQQLQFAKLCEAIQQQLCQDTYLADELLNSLYALGKFCKTPACALQQLASTYPEVGYCSRRTSQTVPFFMRNCMCCASPQFAAKLQRSVKQHPLREMHIEQVSQLLAQMLPWICHCRESSGRAHNQSVPCIQMEGDAVEAVMADAEQLAAMLQPIYKELQVRHVAGGLPPRCANHAGCLPGVIIARHTF